MKTSGMEMRTEHHFVEGQCTICGQLETSDSPCIERPMLQFPKVIEVTPETAQRYLQRRASDKSTREKLLEYQELIATEQTWFESFLEIWLREKAKGDYGPETLGWIEGNVHAHAVTLHKAGVSIDCPCTICTDLRQKEAANCERVGNDKQNDHLGARE